MAYDENLAQRIRKRFATLSKVEEKAMMGGLTFMYNDKMCVGIIKDELMCRIDPTMHDEMIEKPGCRPMDFTHRSQKDFNFWIDLALDFNKQAKSSKKKKN